MSAVAHHPASSPLAARPAASRAGLRAGVVFLLLAFAWLSPEPFKSLSVGQLGTAGNIVNQLAYSFAAVLAVAMLGLSGVRPLIAYGRSIYLLLLLWMVVSIVLSLDVEASARAFAFTLVVLAIGGLTLVIAADEPGFAMAIGLAAFLIVALSYLGVVLTPARAMHTAGDVSEPEHAGAWRGAFDHKNIAGPMMASFAFVGLYVAAVRSRALGWSLFGLATVFLYFTNAKTAMALFPLTILFAWFAEKIRGPFLRSLLCLGPLAILLVFTVGSVLFTPVRELLHAISPGQTFTGRAEIWGFAFDRLAQRPFTGFGFEAFWSSDMVRFAEVGEGETGISSGMPHGHNGYVDVAIGMGLPGVLIVAVILLFLPLADYQKARRFAGNAALSRLWLRVWLFAIYTACLESFFFRRADPVWFTLILAIFGLRLLAVWRIAK